MNNNTIQVITTFTIGIISGVVGLEVTGNILTGAAIGVSYLTVAAVIAMAVSDYRSNAKAYYVSPVITGHFKRAVPASVTLNTQSAKARMAA